MCLANLKCTVVKASPYGNQTQHFGKELAAEWHTVVGGRGGILLQWFIVLCASQWVRLVFLQFSVQSGLSWSSLRSVRPPSILRFFPHPFQRVQSCNPRYQSHHQVLGWLPLGLNNGPIAFVDSELHFSSWIVLLDSHAAEWEDYSFANDRACIVFWILQRLSSERPARGKHLQNTVGCIERRTLLEKVIVSKSYTVEESWF